MGVTAETKFAIEERAFVLAYAREGGQLVGGIIDAIRVDIGWDGTTQPSIWYRMTQTVAFTPPGGLWAEYELGTEAEARTLANAFNRAKSDQLRRAIQS